MRILRPRQRCESCSGSGESDVFGLFACVECETCHGTGYSPSLPPLEYVHPDLVYAVHRCEDTQKEA